METEFKYRGAFNKELAERYDYYSNGELERTVKVHAASAKRTASSLSATLDNFSRVMKPEQVLALKAAASSMQSLAQDLEMLKPWAMSLVAFRQAEQKRKEDMKLDELASERWGRDGVTDAKVIEELEDFKTFVENIDGSRQWLSAIRAMPARLPTTIHQLVSDVDLAVSLKGNELKRHVMLILLKAFSDHWGDRKLKVGMVARDWHGAPEWVTGIDDFDAWRAARHFAQASPSISSATQP